MVDLIKIVGCQVSSTVFGEASHDGKNALVMSTHVRVKTLGHPRGNSRGLHDGLGTTIIQSCGMLSKHDCNGMAEKVGYFDGTILVVNVGDKLGDIVSFLICQWRQSAAFFNQQLFRTLIAPNQQRNLTTHLIFKRNLRLIPWCIVHANLRTIRKGRIVDILNHIKDALVLFGKRVAVFFQKYHLLHGVSSRCRKVFPGNGASSRVLRARKATPIVVFGPSSCC
mmetsp:Transcript_19919/g.33072  ORF Transcript_19919/g.33072 Transcript_19919/m.33072 type:complete len:224 (-) Transcript_19919:206-877(-)